MDIQRLRNLTTGRLHTEIGDIYQDIEYITGMDGLMTHMLPNVMRATTPWLKNKVVGEEFWNDEYDTSHVGEYHLPPMDACERDEMMERYKALPHPFEKAASA
jgi:hypothetical protein